METIINNESELEKKVSRLCKVKVDEEYYRTFYKDMSTGEKWVYERLFPDASPQLRMLDKFPWEEIN